MDIFKLIGIALVGAICSLVLKNTQSQYSALCVIATGIIIIILVLNSLKSVIYTFQELVEQTGINQEIFALLLKIIGIGYLVEYSSNLCNDLDCPSIAKKLAFGGKITLFMMAIPIIKSLINIIIGII